MFGIPAATWTIIVAVLSLVTLIVIPIAHAIVRRTPTDVDNQVVDAIEEILSIINPLAGITEKLVPDTQSDMKNGIAKIIDGQVVLAPTLAPTTSPMLAAPLAPTKQATAQPDLAELFLGLHARIDALGEKLKPAPKPEEKKAS